MFEQESTLICLLHCRFLYIVNPVWSLADDYLEGCLGHYREVMSFVMTYRLSFHSIDQYSIKEIAIN